MARGTWKISIGGSGFGDYNDVIVPDECSGGPVFDTVQPYGASAPVYLDLGNLNMVRSFTMDRIHASNADATNWFMTAVQTWAGVATVVVTHIDYTGTETTFTIVGAKIEISVGKPIGISTTTKIRISGGTST